MANLSFKINTASAFDKLTSKTAGALYFATDSKENVSGTNRQRAYIYYDDGTNKYNIVPRMLGIKNGGTGLDMSTKTANSLVILNSSVNGMTTIASAAGAFFSTGADVLPKYGTLPVEYGGTERTTLTDGALLIGAGQAPIEFVADVAKGSVLMSNGTSANPIYGVMDMRWEPGTTAGPQFVYITNGVEPTLKDAFTIPSASGSNSGIVTTGTQSFAGAKTFNNTMYAANAMPKTSKEGDLGSASYIWNELFHQLTRWYDGNGTLNAHTDYTSGGASATQGTAGTQGYFTLYLGNDIAKSTTLNKGAGNSMGQLMLYGSGSGWSGFYAENTGADNYTVSIPAASGRMVISQGEVATSATYKYLPYYSSLDKTLQYTYAYHLNYTAGATDASGTTELVLGVKTQSKNNKQYYNSRGALTLYSGNSGYVQITPGTSSTSDYKLYLPGDSGQLVYHTNDTKIGSGTNPVYVTAAGKVTASTDNVGGPNTGSTTYKPMHMASGVLTAAAATIGSTTLPVYMKNGAITACSKGDVFSNFSSTPDPDGETLSITVAGQNRTVTLDAASDSQGGVVTTGTQDLAGIKKFINTTDSTATSTGAVVVSGGLGVAKQLRVGSTATFSGVVNAYGGSVKIGTSGESATLSYNTSTDTLTISFP